MDTLDKKLNEVFSGRVVRKDLVHQIKKAANVPSFVLEFLLSKYCATDDPDEIEEGKKAVLDVVEKNYVRADEANKAQSLVMQKGKHKFIDKIHVNFKESDKKHWAAMENFGSSKIAINEKFYKENDKLLEGGIWAEVTVAKNEVEEDNYAFYVENLKPIQLSKFDEQKYFEGRSKFTRDEWIDVVLRSVGLNPEIMNNLPPELASRFPSGLRLKMHFLARLVPLVQNNFNYIELGPRGTGKSYFYSEFSPYSTLLSGGQASTATLLYNNRRKKVGAVGFWDNIGFDEVGNMKIKDSDTVQIMKDYMANGRFSRGQEVSANASFSFVGNIDHSVEQLVNSYDHDLFITLPKALDLAVQDRFFLFLPGWEIPKMDNKFFSKNYGLITDYMAEAFHYMFRHNKDYFEVVNRRLKLGNAVEGRDELAIRKTVTALIKIIHPIGEPSQEHFDDIVAYAVEGRRRVKEQMNKRKPDDEFAAIDLSYFKADGEEVIVYCPESKTSAATHNPRSEKDGESAEPIPGAPETKAKEPIVLVNKLVPKKVDVKYGDTGYGYDSFFGPYLVGAKEVMLEDPYIRKTYQIANFVRFCEMVAKIGDAEKISLVTNFDNAHEKDEMEVAFTQIQDSLKELDIELEWTYNDKFHDRFIITDTDWRIALGRGLHYFQSLEGEYFKIGANDMDLRPCLLTTFDFSKK